MNIAALILAGGIGARTDAAIPKQYLTIPSSHGSITILRASIDAFLRHPAISQVCVVIADKDYDFYNQATRGLALLPPVLGGATRSKSVSNGLEALAGIEPDYVLIHDAARPFVSQSVITRVVDSLANGAIAVDLGIPVNDTIKSTAGGIHTIRRDQLYATQTPQGFRYDTILELHRTNPRDYTDDISLCLESSINVDYVVGESENYKITTAHDYAMSQQQHNLTKVGLGYDVHRFDTASDNGYIMLGGLEVPCKHNIIAHSDGDVLLHALTDAILGVIASGDIGTHFPPNDQQWINAPSSVFLQHALSLLAAKGGRLINIDAVIIAEFPKLSPYREKITESLMKMLALPSDSISIKAKTAEKLDAIGNGLGIAAHVVCCAVF